jgi:aspartyl-tRNA(Asn)/glutamyl-tRNA(Gln) amidotransferase subunit A
VLQAIAGYDPLDTSAVDRPVPDYAAALSGKAAGLRLGIPKDLFYDRLDPDVAAAVEAAIALLVRLGASTRPVHLPSVASLASVGPAETFVYHRQYFAQTPGLYQVATRRRLERASRTSGADYVDAHRTLERIRREILSVFQDVDLLVTPTTPRPPYTITESLRRDEAESLPPLLSNTGPFNVYGLPAISIPCGFTGDGLPIGLQIAGPPFGEPAVLALAHAYQRASTWHNRIPAMKATSPTRKATE